MSTRFYVGQKDYLFQLNAMDDQVQAGAGGSVNAGVFSFNGRNQTVTLTQLDVTNALAYVPVSPTDLAAYLNASGTSGLYAPKISPTFSGTITVVTYSAGDNTTKVASTAFARNLHVRGAGVLAVAFSATPNFAAGTDQVFSITLTGNVTGATIATGTDGQRLMIRAKQGPTGNYTFGFAGGMIRIGTAGPGLSLAGTAGSTTYLGLVYNADAALWDLVSVSGGF